MTTAWKPEQYADTYREKVDKLIRAKRRGREVIEENEPPESTNVVNLIGRAAGERRAGEEDQGRQVLRLLDVDGSGKAAKKGTSRKQRKKAS
ncbi:MAG: hypothetical protein GEV10_10055 [Streptosporangiales bacterium]|nr:hypothetical protein [Streptosporangiales bacterium]